VSTAVRSRGELAGVSIADAVTARGKELTVGDAAATARRLFENPSVQVIPVLDGGRYVGAVDRAAVHSGTSDAATLGSLARNMLPVCRAGTPAPVALDLLDECGANRLVVLDDHDESYVGLICVRSDRERLCVDAECHAQPSSSIERET
jgi:CBS domain-containing protein